MGSFPCCERSRELGEASRERLGRTSGWGGGGAVGSAGAAPRPPPPRGSRRRRSRCLAAPVGAGGDTPGGGRGACDAGVRAGGHKWLAGTAGARKFTARRPPGHPQGMTPRATRQDTECQEFLSDVIWVARMSGVRVVFRAVEAGQLRLFNRSRSRGHNWAAPCSTSSAAATPPVGAASARPPAAGSAAAGVRRRAYVATERFPAASAVAASVARLKSHSPFRAWPSVLREAVSRRASSRRRHACAARWWWPARRSRTCEAR